VIKAFEQLKLKNIKRTRNMKLLSISKEYSRPRWSQWSILVGTTKSKQSKTKKKSTLEDACDTPFVVAVTSPKTRGKAYVIAIAKALEEDGMASTLIIFPGNLQENQ